MFHCQFTELFFLDECVNFLKKQANSLGLPIRVYEVVPQKPIVVLTWEGKDPKLPSVLLNSHMDVVPVFEVSLIYFENNIVQNSC